MLGYLLLKKPSLDLTILDNFHPVSNLSFLEKIVEQVVMQQLQRVLDEANYLDLFQSGFRPGYGTKTALVTLLMTCSESGMEIVCSSLHYLSYQEPLITLMMVSFWTSCSSWE